MSRVKFADFSSLGTEDADCTDSLQIIRRILPILPLQTTCTCPILPANRNLYHPYQTMPRSFSEKDKAKALKLLASGMTYKDAAAQIGCSTFSLKDWKKKAKNGVASDKSEGTPKCCIDNGCEAPVAKKCEVNDLERKFWSRSNRAVDMLLNPKDLTSEEAVKLVNEALAYAQEQLKK